jgi:prolycopene isomerase
LDNKVTIKKHDPSNIIITPDFRVSYWTDIDKTIKEFQNIFPHESTKIKKYFYFLTDPNQKYFSSVKRLTFKDLLDNFFIDDKLKAILSFPLISNGGLPPSLMSAFVGIKIYEEFLLDGGYYPEDGMQTLSNALAERFNDFGGTLLLSCPVKKIKVTDNTVKGIIIRKNTFISSQYVVSNCDARETFLKLLGIRNVNNNFIIKIKKMIPSLSAFILYLGMDNYINELPNRGINLWFLSNYDLDKMFLAAQKVNFDKLGCYLLYIYPNRRSVLAFINAPFKNNYFWVKNKAKITKSFIKRIEIEAIPDLSKHLEFKDSGTPYTLYRYTSNYKGAAFGWASTPSQLADPDFRKPSSIQGLYLTGHWSTRGFGIPGVAYVGYDTAKVIVKRRKMS